MLCPIRGSSAGEGHVGASPPTQGWRRWCTRSWLVQPGEGKVRIPWDFVELDPTTATWQSTKQGYSQVLLCSQKQKQICPTLPLTDTGPSAPCAPYLGGHLQPGAQQEAVQVTIFHEGQNHHGPGDLLGAQLDAHACKTQTGCTGP